MKVEAKDLLDYHFPRFDELPEIELYIDQVICVVQKNLSIFSKNKETPVITPSMINNYVKQEVLEPPKKKKYNKEHLAYLFVICILKKSMSILEIKESINIMRKSYSVEEEYNLFCDEIEKALMHTFKPENNIIIEDYMQTESRKVATVRAMAMTFANSVLVDRLIMMRGKDEIVT